MFNLMLSTLKAPSGLWMKIITWINGGVLNFAWAIVLFTLLIKLILSPLDFFIKYSNKKSTLVQQKCAPQLDKLKKKYNNNQQMLAQQQQALYKKEGYNMVSSCLILLANLVVTILVFFSIYTTLREASAYYAIKQYEELNTAYTGAYEKVLLNNGSGYVPGEDYSEDQIMLDAIKEAKLDPSVSEAVKEKWDEVKDSWLWVTNIWVKDGHAESLPTYKDLQNLAKNAKGIFNSGVQQNYIETVNNIDETHYNEVTSFVTKDLSGWNGYYILAIIAGVATFLSSFVSELGTKLNREKKEPVKTNKYIKSPEPQKEDAMAQTGGSMKILKFALPVIMILFVVSSSAAFGLYIVTQSLISTLLGLLINLLVNSLTKQKQLEVLAYLDKIERK